jgi:p-aminobenzoyl-glutamate transporter AbgT
MNLKNMRECDYSKIHISSNFILSANNIRYLLTSTITTLQHFATLHHTSPHFTTLHQSVGLSDVLMQIYETRPQNFCLYRLHFSACLTTNVSAVHAVKHLFRCFLLTILHYHILTNNQPINSTWFGSSKPSPA